MDIRDKIIELKNKKNALILAHFYQSMEIQMLADRVGDSFELSKVAKDAKNEIIVFCGVRFMAESAKILNRGKKVLLPEENAGCPMADMVTPEKIRHMRKLYPDAAVVCYVNSSAECKAESDICCTSSNALRVVESLPNKDIIFVPDKNLGAFAAKHFQDKSFHFIDGCCPIHNRVTEEDVIKAKKEHPNASLLIHPECSATATRHADYAGSTSGIIDYATKSDKNEFIIGTEKTIADRLSWLCPDKKFYPLTQNFVCADMQKTTTEKLYRALEEERYEITLSDELCDRAYSALIKMTQI